MTGNIDMTIYKDKRNKLDAYEILVRKYSADTEERSDDGSNLQIEMFQKIIYWVKQSELK